MILPSHILRCVIEADRKTLGKAGLLPEEAVAKGVARAERYLQGEIVQYLHLRGIEVLWHRTDKKSHATIGWPDLTFCKDGVPWAIEVKTGIGRVSAAQCQTMRKMELNGWQVAVVYSFREFHNKVFRGHD